uniref:Uncharacterized protein ycf35 n=1 Tax=Eucheuma denticulatum TaxID=305493 RepID=A0A8E7UEJ5_9FLOR|nr:hypothetical protein [Eucheuma denticulatum]
MSHLSRIQTSITSKEILEKTLQDLKFTYEYKVVESNKYIKSQVTTDIIVKKNNSLIFTFSWNGQEYSLLADLELWKFNISFEKLLEKIKQQYSYNSIIRESTKYGFESIEEHKIQDGSVKIVLQRWNS